MNTTNAVVKDPIKRDSSGSNAKDQISKAQLDAGRISGMMAAASDLGQGSFGIVAHSRTVTGQATTTVCTEEGGTGPAVGTLVEKSVVNDEKIQIISKGRASTSVPAGAIIGVNGNRMDTTTRPTETAAKRDAGSHLAVGVTAESVVAKHLTSNVFQKSIHLIQSQDSNVKHLWTAPAPTPTFIGRQDVMDATHNKLQSCAAREHYLSRMVALVGPAGMGKTEIARAFAQKYKTEYEVVGWVDAGTERSLRVCFIRMAKILKIPYMEEVTGKELAELVYAHVSEYSEKPAVFIFDNARGLESSKEHTFSSMCALKSMKNIHGIRNYLPTKVQKNTPLILITSESTEWKKNCEVIEVTGLSIEEALLFFQTVFKLSQEEMQCTEGLLDLLRNLAQILNGNPSVLRKTASQISSNPGNENLLQLNKKLKGYIKSWHSRYDRKRTINAQESKAAGRCTATLSSLAPGETTPLLSGHRNRMMVSLVFPSHLSRTWKVPSHGNLPQYGFQIPRDVPMDRGSRACRAVAVLGTLLVVVGLTVSVFKFVPHVPKPSIYFATESGYLKAYLLETFELRIIGYPEEGLIGVAYDSMVNKIYSCSYSKIYRANADGSGRETVLRSKRYGDFYSLSFDWIVGNMYVAHGGGHIMACNKRRARKLSCATVLSNQGMVHGMALNPTEGSMYFTNSSVAVGTGNIVRAGMDGSSPVAVVAGLSSPHGITIDFNTSTLFWTDCLSNRIESSTFEGTDRRTVVQLSSVCPYGIAVANERIYWGENSGTKLKSSTMAGKDVVTLPTGIYVNFFTGLARVPDSSLPQNRTNDCAVHSCDKVCVLTATSCRCLF